jgi:hypothetical protein
MTGASAGVDSLAAKISYSNNLFAIDADIFGCNKDLGFTSRR